MSVSRNFFAFPVTTDQGIYYRKHPINIDGTAIVIPGQYRGLWHLGKHRNKYDALVQVGDIKVWRDVDRDGKLDQGDVQEGLFGINAHRANATRASTQVDKWSAGCQVFQDPDHFDFFLALCRAQVDTHPTYTKFSYTLLNESDLP